MATSNNKPVGSFDKEYYYWISELSSRYRQSQIKAAVRVNNEMLRFYWSVGKDIEERQFENKYGSHFYVLHCRLTIPSINHNDCNRDSILCVFPLDPMT